MLPSLIIRELLSFLYSPQCQGSLTKRVLFPSVISTEFSRFSFIDETRQANDPSENINFALDDKSIPYSFISDITSYLSGSINSLPLTNPTIILAIDKG